ncbi:RRM domain-containing protein [Madurella fahalii]|uniref:RRM domain-containing protein n=1 Tax=Madurella fahalii TaxID=1157608 RepID=A0ABQ0G3T1_9PEZI
MDMVSSAVRRRRERPTRREIARRVAAGCSPNYMGNIALRSNRPANIPDELNCSLWITGLPPNVTVGELLAAIRNVGKVYATVVNPPDGRHPFSAAKVTFFTPTAAQTLLAQCNGPDKRGLIVGNCRARVRYNRNAVEQPEWVPEDHTRAIIVSGPPDIINIEFLMDYFRRRFDFQLESIDVLAAGHSINVLEWRFGSYRAQANSAWKALTGDAIFKREYPGVNVRFVHDPCDARNH